MRKANSIRANEDQRVPALQVVESEPTRSWMPAPSFALAAMDPAQWSQRKAQRNVWRLLERLQSERILH